MKLFVSLRRAEKKTNLYPMRKALHETGIGGTFS